MSQNHENPFRYTWAELARLLAVEREPGCKLVVSVLDLPDPEARPNSPAVVRTDPLELVAPGLSTPPENPPGRSRLLALAGSEPIGRVRAGAGRLGGVRPVSILGLPRVGYTGSGRVGFCCETAGPVSGRVDPGRRDWKWSIGSG